MARLNATRRPAAYLRASKDPGTKQEHLARLMAAVHEAGHNGNAILYDDWAKSGDRQKLGKRTGWLQLCLDIEADRIGEVFLNDLDRGGRSMEEWLRFMRVCQEHNVRVVAGGTDWSTPDKRMEFRFRALVAEEELEADRRRSHGTRAMQRARGDAFGHAPYGYRNVREGYDASGRGYGRVLRVPNPDEPLEPLLAAVRATRGNILAACKALNAEGTIPTRSGEPWSTRTLTSIVKRAEPRLLRQAPSIRTKSGKINPPSPLSKLVLCHCGRIMTPVRGRGELMCAYGRKIGKAHGQMSGQEHRVMTFLRAEVEQAAAALIHFTRPGPAADAASQRAKLEEDRQRAGRSYRARAMSDEEFDAEIARLDEALAELDAADDNPAVLDPRIGPLVDWDADPVALGDALRRVFRSVQMDERQRPVSAVWRHPEWRSTS